MKAAVIEEIGQPPVTQDVDRPNRGPRQALVEVAAAAINPIDISISTGRFHGGSPAVPYVLGREGVGRVVEGDALDPGTPIWFQPPDGGTFAEFAIADETSAIVLPNGTDDVLAAALGIAALTGWLAVEWRARLREGEKVLVLGATGVVGLVAVQAARRLGASRVVAAGRDAEVLERTLALGAHATVQLSDGSDAGTIADEFREAMGGAPDVILDPLWGIPAQAAVEAAAPDARLVQLGQSAGAEATLRSAAIRGKSLAILGFTLDQVPDNTQQVRYLRMIESAAVGDLVVDREALPLDRAAEAWQRQQDSPHCKLVLRP